MGLGELNERYAIKSAGGALPRRKTMGEASL